MYHGSLTSHLLTALCDKLMCSSRQPGKAPGDEPLRLSSRSSCVCVCSCDIHPSTHHLATLCGITHNPLSPPPTVPQVLVLHSMKRIIRMRAAKLMHQVRLLFLSELDTAATAKRRVRPARASGKPCCSRGIHAHLSIQTGTLAPKPPVVTPGLR